MKKINPLVSIIMNCHNGEKYLSKSISSIFSQSYKNWELIFFDNNSNDNSKNVDGEETDDYGDDDYEEDEKYKSCGVDGNCDTEGNCQLPESKDGEDVDAE